MSSGNGIKPGDFVEHKAGSVVMYVEVVNSFTHTATVSWFYDGIFRQATIDLNALELSDVPEKC